jgi:hypothetical protein
LDIFISVYMDNILIYSQTLKEHIKHVRTVLHALKKAKLQLEPSKCKFHKEQIKFVGYYISAEGLEVDPEKVARVKE